MARARYYILYLTGNHTLQDKHMINIDQYSLLDDEELSPYEADLRQIDEELAQANRAYQEWRHHINTCRNIASAIHSWRFKKLMMQSNEAMLKQLEKQEYRCAETGVPLTKNSAQSETAMIAIGDRRDMEVRWVSAGWLNENDILLFLAQAKELEIKAREAK